MNYSSLYMLISLPIGGIFFGYRAYVSWFRPSQHEEHLKEASFIYEGWAPASKMWMTSKFNFWLTRFIYSIGFIICVVGVVLIILN